MPRIAHVISSRGIGGAERFLAALVARAAARGWEQVVLNPFAAAGSEALASLCAPVACERRRCDSVLQLVSTRAWLQGRLEAFSPDVVHILLFQALVTMGTVRTAPGTCRVATNVYGDWPRTAPHGRVIRLADRWAARRVDHIAAISESVRGFLLSEYRYPPSHVTCIRLGWEGDPKPTRTGPRPPTIVCVGGLRPEKGHDVLVAAMPLVRRDVPDARLVVIGDGDLRPALEAQAVAAGVRDAVDFLGSVPDVWEHLADADVFALASRSEAFGIAIAEAMAAGLPVVAPEVGAIPELVRPGETGELYPPGDHEALAANLVGLLQAPDRRARMARDAREAAASLTMEDAVGRYVDLFERVCASAGRNDDAR